MQTVPRRAISVIGPQACRISSRSIKYRRTTPLLIRKLTAQTATIPTTPSAPSDHLSSSKQAIIQPTLSLSPSAVAKLQSIRDQERNANVALRISVESGGCHGYQYKMDLEDISQDMLVNYRRGYPDLSADDQDDDDMDRLVGTGDPPYLILDPLSLRLCKGSKIDYATELIGSSFRIDDNPQAKGAGCGCGVSWELA